MYKKTSVASSSAMYFSFSKYSKEKYIACVRLITNINEYRIITKLNCNLNNGFTKFFACLMASTTKNKKFEKYTYILLLMYIYIYLFLYWTVIKSKITHRRYYFSNIIVTGPSFRRLTFISAPNIPFWTSIPFSLHLSQKYSYNLFAISGFAAFTKDGLFPPVQSA